MKDLQACLSEWRPDAAAEFQVVFGFKTISLPMLLLLLPLIGREDFDHGLVGGLRGLGRSARLSS